MTISMRDIAEATAVLRELRDLDLMDASPRHLLAIKNRASSALLHINSVLAAIPVTIQEGE